MTLHHHRRSKVLHVAISYVWICCLRQNCSAVRTCESISWHHIWTDISYHSFIFLRLNVCEIIYTNWDNLQISWSCVILLVERTHFLSDWFGEPWCVYLLTALTTKHANRSWGDYLLTTSLSICSRGITLGQSWWLSSIIESHWWTSLSLQDTFIDSKVIIVANRTLTTIELGKRASFIYLLYDYGVNSSLTIF